MLNNRRSGSGQTLMVVGAVVVIVGLAPIVAPALLSMGGVGAGKPPPQIDQLVEYHLSARESLGSTVAVKFAAAGSAFAASVLAAFAAEQSRILWNRMARAKATKGLVASSEGVVRRATLP
jgi:hypothetical protein